MELWYFEVLFSGGGEFFHWNVIERFFQCVMCTVFLDFQFRRIIFLAIVSALRSNLLVHISFCLPYSIKQITLTYIKYLIRYLRTVTQSFTNTSLRQHLSFCSCSFGGKRLSSPQYRSCFFCIISKLIIGKPKDLASLNIPCIQIVKENQAYWVHALWGNQNCHPPHSVSGSSLLCLIAVKWS